MATKNYPCPACGKKLKLTHGFTRYMNICTSHQVHLIHMQPKQDTPIPREDENASENIRPYEYEKLKLEKQDIQKDYRNLGAESLDTGCHARDDLLRYIPQAGLLGSKSLSSLREIRFSDQEFIAGTPISKIKFNYPGFQNNNFFYLFHN